MKLLIDHHDGRSQINESVCLSHGPVRPDKFELSKDPVVIKYEGNRAARFSTQKRRAQENEEYQKKNLSDCPVPGHQIMIHGLRILNHLVQLREPFRVHAPN